jgi:hypothetical protein
VNEYSEVALWMKTPENEQRLAIFHVDIKKEGYLGYIKGLVKAFADIEADILTQDKLPSEGLYFLGVDGAAKIYDFRFAKSVPYRLKSSKVDKKVCLATLKNIMSYLLLNEVKNIIAAEKGEASGRREEEG